jgi:spermidine synthase
MKTSSFARAVRLLFFASGFCGLVYEIIWAKILHAIVGCSLHAVTLVMAAFMSGLALGGLVGGRLTRSRRNGLEVYALLEMCIGCFALLSPLVFDGLIPLYVGLHRVLGASDSGAHAIRFALGFLALVVPAAMMGATLPVVTHDLDRRAPGLVRNLGYLYGLNTLGAALGCLVAGFLLIPALGITWTVRGAAFVNLAAAALALRISRRAPPATAPMPAVDKHVPHPSEEEPANRVALLLPAFALSGFFSMGYEVLWTKAIAFFVSNTAYAFSAMLTTFLLGLGAGGVLVGIFASRIKRHWFTFGLIEVLIGASALASIVIFAKLTYPGHFDNSSATPVWFKFAYAFLVMFLPTSLMGLLLPLAGRILVRGPSATGTSVGRLYAVNTLGCVAGAAVAGFALVPWLGIQKSILLLCGSQVLLGLVLILRAPDLSSRHKVAWALPVAALLLVSVGVLPTGNKIYSSANRAGMPEGESIFYREGAASIVEVLESPDGNRHLVINGSLNASPYPVSVGVRAHRLIAQLPLLLHPDPRRMLLLGLGSGMTSGAALRFDGLESIECAELSRDVALASDYFERWNHGVTRSPKFKLSLEDGRNFLLTSTHGYDVITLESIHPKWDAGNASLYSRDFYQLCKSRLNPGGLISQWAPLNGMTLPEFKTILRTFGQVFPHASLWFVKPSGYLASTNAILLGARERLSIDTDHFLSAAERPSVARDLVEEDVDDPIQLLDGFIMEGETLRHFAGQEVPLNTDDHPVLEYGPVVNQYEKVLAALAPVRGSVRPWCRPPTTQAHGETFFARLHKQFEASQLAIQGDLAHLRGEHDRAIGRYGAAFLIDPANRPIVESYKNVQFKGNYQFLRTLDRAGSWRPEEIHKFLRIMFHRDDRDAVLWTGRQYQMAGWHEAARAQYRQVLAMDPRNADAATYLREIPE